MKAVLTGHDIPVFINGQNAAPMLGLASSAVALDVWVAQADAEQAVALIRELREGGEGALADDEIPADDTGEPVDDADDEPAAATVGDTLTRMGKRKRIALAITVGVFMQHGTAHMSARAWTRGFVLAGVQLLGWRTLAIGNPRGGIAIIAATVLMDILGALMVIAQSQPSDLPTARVRKAR